MIIVLGDMDDFTARVNKVNFVPNVLDVATWRMRSYGLASTSNYFLFRAM